MMGCHPSLIREMVPSKSNRAALKSLRTLLLRHSMDCISYLLTYFIKALLVLCLAVTLRSYRHCSCRNTHQTGPGSLGTGGAGGAGLCNYDGRSKLPECCVLRRSPRGWRDNYTCACATSPAPTMSIGLHARRAGHAPPEFRRTPTARSPHVGNGPESADRVRQRAGSSMDRSQALPASNSLGLIIERTRNATSRSPGYWAGDAAQFSEARRTRLV